MYRVVPRTSSPLPGRSYGVPQQDLTPRDPIYPPRLKTAQDHLLWKQKPTSFISLFNSEERELRWAAILEKRDLANLDLVVIDTLNMPRGSLHDAGKLARLLGFPQFRVNCSKGEYVWTGEIGSEYVCSRVPILRSKKFKAVLEEAREGGDFEMGQEDVDDAFAGDFPERRCPVIEEESLGSAASGSDFQELSGSKTTEAPMASEPDAEENEEPPQVVEISTNQAIVWGREHNRHRAIPVLSVQRKPSTKPPDPKAEPIDRKLDAVEVIKRTRSEGEADEKVEDRLNGQKRQRKDALQKWFDASVWKTTRSGD